MRRIPSVAVFLLVSMAFGAFAAGGGEAEETGQPEVLSFSVYQPFFGSSWTETAVYDPMMEMFEQYMGMPIDIEWEEIGFGDYWEKRNIYWATGDFADVFTAIGWNEVQEAGDNGLIADILEYEDSLVYYSEYFLDVGFNRDVVVNDEGRLYSFVSSIVQDNTGTQHGWAYRHDVLEDAGIGLPRTMDDFYQAAQTLKELYPDSYPVSGLAGIGEAQHDVVTSLLIHNRTFNRIAFDGNEFVFGPTQQSERFREVVAFLARLYEENLLDPEFVNHTDEQLFAKMINGDVFMTPALYSAYVEQHLNSNSNFDGEWVVPKRPTNFQNETGWKRDSGYDGAVLQTLFGIAISEDAPNKDLIVKLLDYQHSPEVVELGSWGWEGVSYERDADGSIEFMDFLYEMDRSERQAQLEEWGIYPALSIRPGITFFPQDRTAVGAFDFAPAWDGDSVLSRNFWQFTSEVEGPESIWPEGEGYRPPTSFTQDERDFITNNMTPVTTFVDESVARFIIGETPMSEFDTFIERIEDLGDWQAVVDLYNSKL